MSPMIRDARPEDIPQMVDLLLADAAERQAHDPILWTLSAEARTRIETALTEAFTAQDPPIRQIWQVAEEAGRLTGVVHAMLLPVPPIYAGPMGEPGLILPDSFVVPGAAEGTVEALITSVEAALQAAGARLLVSSYVVGEAWKAGFARLGYDPLTLYLSRAGFDGVQSPAAVRPATPADVPGIVARSAQHRRILFDIDPFWETHPEADPRFAAWMQRSLTLPDRDMMVLGPAEALDGYVIAQPASRLHFPPAHDITRTGVLDDFYHVDLQEVAQLSNGGAGATTVLHAAEAAFAARGMTAGFVVCPAGWPSKIAMLEAAGYATAMVWSIKRQRAEGFAPDMPA